MAFSTVWIRRENKRDEKWEENNPFGPTLFYPPNLGGKWGGKYVDDIIYINTLTLLHSPTPLTFPLLYNKDIIVNLYKLHFSYSPFYLQSNKKVFHPPLFHPSNQTRERKPNIFYPPTFSSSH